MIRQIPFLFLLILLPLQGHPQRKVSKRDILKYMDDKDKRKIKFTGYKSNFDPIVVREIDSLKNHGIDTIGVYSEEYVGCISLDSCECGDIPWIAYVQWIENGKTFQKKITHCCHFEPIVINCSAIVRYYINSKKIIDKERIVPFADGLYKDKHGYYSLGMLIVDHTTHYNIYCETGRNSSFITFEEFDIEEKENLFNVENNNTAINSWRKLIQNQINEKKVE